VPTIWIVFMMGIPYIDRSREGVGIWFTSPRGKRVTYFAAVYATAVTFSLIIFDKVLKDHGYIEFASQYLPGGKQLFPDYIIPITTMIVLSALLVVLVRVIFRGNTRDVMIAVWTGFVCVFLVLTVVGTSMRGPGMDMYAPWALPSTHQCFAP
jgi:L-asparagine transporter-like permease